MLASCGGASGLKEVTASEFKEATSGFDADALVAAIETFDCSVGYDGERAMQIVADVKNKTYLYEFIGSGDEGMEILVFLEEGKDTYTVSVASSSYSSSPMTQTGVASDQASSYFSFDSLLETFTLPNYLESIAEEEEEEGTTYKYYTGDGYEIVGTYDGDGQHSTATCTFGDDGYLTSLSASYSYDATESESAYSGTYEMGVTINQEIQKKTSL